MFENLAFVLYTHTDCQDVWPLFAGQTKKYVPDQIKKYIIVDSKYDDSLCDYEAIIYDDSDIYRKRLVDTVSKISQDYILFHHEDMFLYKQADWERISKYQKFLIENDYDFIKLIRGGRKTGPLVNIHHPELRLIDKSFVYIFAIQPTLWRRSCFLDICKNGNGNTIWQFEIEAQKFCRNIDIKGCYVDDGGIKRGKYHWDSLVYPYVATAVVKGKWNSEYKKELVPLMQEYQIDANKRGWR